MTSVKSDMGGLCERGTIEVAGTESLAFLPLARSTSLELQGNWPHPGFARAFLQPGIGSQRGAQRGDGKSLLRLERARNEAVFLQLHVPQTAHVRHRNEQSRPLEMQAFRADARELRRDIERRLHVHFRDVDGHFVNAELTAVVLHAQLGLERE